jgi:hypothetical protein
MLRLQPTMEERVFAQLVDFLRRQMGHEGTR